MKYDNIPITVLVSKNQTINVPVYKILVLLASSSIEGSGESVHKHRLARAFAACIHQVSTEMKTRTKN